MLRAIGRLSSGAENIDLDACARAGVEVVRPADGSAQAEAEFAIGAMLQLLRRVPVVNAEGLLVGRELGGATRRPGRHDAGRAAAGAPARRLRRRPSSATTRRCMCPTRLWRDWGVEPMALRELIETCDVVCVLLGYFSRYRGLIGERYLSACKPDQVLVSLAHSSTFDERALAEALASGRMAAAWFDSMEPGMLDPGRPLHGVDQPAGHAACGEHDARIARAQRLVGGAPHRRAAVGRRTRRRASCRTCQPLSLILQTSESLAEVGQALAFLLDHRGRRARDEAFVGQLGLGLADLPAQAIDLLAQAFELGDEVDLDVQRQPQRLDDDHRRRLRRGWRRPSRRRARAPPTGGPAP